jgi:ubiquinone/menaquinone biosynthesis C-methylase UbiE
MWVGYYLLLLAHQSVRPRRVLDLCCGTGTMCELLTEEKFVMAGVDLSAPMIEAARKKAKKKKLDIRYEVGDASTFDMGETYEAVFSFFDSLNNITDPERFRMAIERAYAHIEPGGSFIFDLNTAYAFEAQLFDQQNLRKTSKLRYQWHGDWNPETQLITVNMKFWYGGAEFDEVHVQRAYPHEDILEMLEDVGFREIKAYHSYTLNPPRFKSDRLHYTALKP